MSFALVALAALAAVLLLTHTGGEGKAPAFAANGCPQGYNRLGEEYVRELRAGAVGEQSPGKGEAGRENRERVREEAEREASSEARGELIPSDVRVPGKGFCLKQGVRAPEPFADLTKASDAVSTRLGLDSPATAARAARQKARLRQAGTAVAGTAGSWSPVGSGFVRFDNPAYTEGNGLSTGLSRGAGRITDYAYDEQGGRLFAAVANGGVWMSTDTGKSWTSIGDNLPTQIVGAVGWTPAGGGTLIALTGDNAFGGSTYAGQGIFWSTDLGKTWHKAAGAPDGAQGFRVQVQQDAPTKVYAATGFGLFRSTDAGRTWTDVLLPTGDCAGKSATKKGCFLANVVTDVQVRSADAFGHAGGAVTAVVGWRAGQRKSPDGSVQAPANGVYTSENGAPGSFAKTPDGAGFPATKQVGRVSLGSAYGPKQNHDYLYAVVQDAELFNSGKILGLDVPEITDPVLGVNLTATPTYLNGVYVSKDFGKTWKQMATGTQFLLPTNNSTLASLAVLGFGPGIQSWYNSWIQPDPYAQTAAGIPTRLDMGLEEVFESRTVGQAQDGQTDFVAVAPYANIGAATAGCILVITQKICQTQAQTAGSTVHPDQHAAQFVPGNPRPTLVIGNDGGAFAQQVPASGNFTAKGFGLGNVTGFNTLLPYSAAVAKDGVIYAGLQDNGTIRIDPKSGESTEVYGGDGTYSLVDPDDSNQALYAPAGGDITVTHDGGKTNASVLPNGVRDAQFLTPFAFDDTTSARVMYAARDIFIADAKIKDITADSFRGVYDLGTQQHPGVQTQDATAKDPSNVSTAIALHGGVGYVGYCGSCDPVKDNLRFKSGVATNSGGTWHIAKAAGLPQRVIDAIAVDPADAKTIYVALGGSSIRQFAPPQALGDDGVDPAGGHLYKSTDGGDTFTDISGDLPKVGATAVIVKGNQLIVGTALGAFASVDKNGGRFGELGTDLPAAPVVSLALDPANPNRLVAASFGRGVYSYTFKDPQAAIAGCKDATAPVSRYTTRSRRLEAGRRLALRGTSSDKGCFSKKRGKVKRVTVSIAKAAGRQCRYLQANGRFAAKATSCARTRYLPARGFRKAASKGTWSFTTKRTLTKGQYKVWVRAIDTSGNVERKKRARNGLQIVVR